MIKLLKRIARKGLNTVSDIREKTGFLKLEKNHGYCNICEEETVFVIYGEWLRETYRCKRCQTTPRNRALINALNLFCKEWPSLQLHESSPSINRPTRALTRHYGTSIRPRHGTLTRSFPVSIRRISFQMEWP
ncbi:MAG TPA: hypothetical protein VFJ43_12670, partial [Bacteroidia bacterium]|nr:hypothetical protein [Bacteroidia bacterium]